MGQNMMQPKGAGGTAGIEGPEVAVTVQGVWSGPVEHAEPDEDHNAEELPTMVQRPEIAELCNVVACKQ